ncbi:unnamed protein product [Citrullus colocynthis]|uniref:Thionin-like protein 2 n=1 Tax=Citrullus colocynthis TaxID=252529 RepID=A0ABP0XR67_9ROSI
MKSVVVICFILSLVAGRSTAAFRDCYSKCFDECAAKTPFIALHICAAKCMGECLINPPSPMASNHMDTHYFCKLGCATSLCTKFSTKENSAEEKVESCVNSCGQTCMKN